MLEREKFLDWLERALAVALVSLGCGLAAGVLEAGFGLRLALLALSGLAVSGLGAGWTWTGLMLTAGELSRA